jgi:hypothetical protein
MPSGFITPLGLDLDSIFQLKPTTPTPDATDLIIVPPTGFKVEDKDLATRYRTKGRNTYTSNTKFNISNGADLKSLFESGEYTPTVAIDSEIIQGRAAAIQVSGNYYTVDISGSALVSGRVTDNPFTFYDGVLEFDTLYNFNVKSYNGFGTVFAEISHPFKTLPKPTLGTVTTTLPLGVMNFSFSGSYTKILWRIEDYADGTFDFGYFESSSVAIIPTVSQSIYIVYFTPLTFFDEEGVPLTKKITYQTLSTSQSIGPSNTTVSSTAFSVSYLFKADILIIAGGGAGSSGGNKTSGGTAGGGGGGGSGSYDSFTINDVDVFNGSITERSVQLTTGRGGTGAQGVLVNQGRDGYLGEDGTDSSITIGTVTYTSNKGLAGKRGSQNGPNGFGGLGGSPNGVAGSPGLDGLFGGSGGAGGVNNLRPLNGAGSDGSKGESGEGTPNTLSGNGGFTSVKLYLADVVTVP